MAAEHPRIQLPQVFSGSCFSPGLEVDVRPLKFYADAEVPVYQNFVGNQIAAPVLIKATIAYEF